MRIGIDISPITTTRTGVGNYCHFLLRHLLAIAPEHEFVGFSSGSARVDLGAMKTKVRHRHIPIPTRAMYAVWTALRWPKVDEILGGVDVYHATNFFLPPTRRAKRVLTIHDLAFLAMPELCSPAIVGPFSKGIRRFAAEADAILAYSESTKRDIVRLLDVDPKKIVAAPIAADPDLRPMPREAAQARLETQYGIKPPFLLFVGTLEPRKNVAGIIRAFSSIAGDIPHTLVLVGPEGWNAAAIIETIDRCRLEKRVVRPGFAPREDLPAFYSAADAFVFPTRYEGFGLPLLEAMTCGCPVITSDNSSVREVAGDAALYAPCDDIEAIASGIRRVIEDATLRESLVARGYAQISRFSWERCAQTTLEVYTRLVH